MTPEVWLVGLLGLVLGAAVVGVIMQRRTKREVIARTLVPHRTRQVIGALQSGAIVVRRDRRAAYSNKSAAALGVARPDGALHAAVADLAERAWDREEPVEEEIVVKRGVLGSASMVHVRATPLDDELVLAVANDNTEARAAEQHRREFAVNVSHELKTPVGALSLLAESIEAGADDAQMVREFAGKIRRESRRLTKLIQEIIEISRLQGGQSVMDYDDVSLIAAVDDAIEGAQVGAQARRIELVRDVKAQPLVLGDRDLLTMAVRNLIDNAVNYSDPGKRVTVSVTTDQSVAVVTVIDQGIGIEPSDRERIFERFFRTDPARSRETGGTGLGLSIVKHVALQHSGSVDVWSQVGVGSTFTLKLQVHQEEAP
jgi:two-component system sensor histidine kinase SenX3